MESKVYKDSFSEWIDVADNFSLDKDRKEPEFIFAIYDYGSYNGTALVIYSDDNITFFIVEGSHCSCYGLEGQWDPTETSREVIIHMASQATYGLFEIYRDEILEWLSEISVGPVQGRSNVDATLENWELYRGRISGDIYGDRKQRFRDGVRVSTSIITYRNGNYVETLNSRYLLGTPLPDADKRA